MSVSWPESRRNLSWVSVSPSSFPTSAFPLDEASWATAAAATVHHPFYSLTTPHRRQTKKTPGQPMCARMQGPQHAGWVQRTQCCRSARDRAMQSNRASSTVRTEHPSTHVAQGAAIAAARRARRLVSWALRLQVSDGGVGAPPPDSGGSTAMGAREPLQARGVVKACAPSAKQE